MFLSTMNVVVGSSAGPVASKMPFVLSKAGANRAAAAGTSRFPQSVPAARDRIDLGSQMHRHPTLMPANGMPGTKGV